MSETRIPITDAFDATDHLKSLEVELTAEQLEWLRAKAAERDLSLDHMLRSVITAQMRAQGDSAVPPSGDGMTSPSASSSSPVQATSDADTDTTDDSSPSIVDSLRSASERLQDLTEQDDDAETPDPHDTLERLQARLGENSDADEESDADNPGTVILQNQNRSMFDMMEDE